VLVLGPAGSHLMYSDEALKLLKPDVRGISRLTNIEYDGPRGKWIVRRVYDGQAVFWHEERNVCLLWEQAHAEDLIQTVQCLQQARARQEAIEAAQQEGKDNFSISDSVVSDSPTEFTGES